VIDSRLVRASALAAVALALAACGSTDRGVSKAKPELASGEPVPSHCVAGKARAKATVTFVANGYAWALDPASGRLTCLFRVHATGPFTWGPRGDRALLARLQVKSLGDAPSRPPGAVDPPTASWGRPIGKSIVFVGRHGRALLKAHPAGGGFLDVTPVRGALYKRVAYHPSGLAFGFILQRHSRESVWISTNLGKKPHQLVHGRFHTGFEALAFGDHGNSIYFAALHKDNHVDVHVLPLVGANSAPVLWHGRPGEHVSAILPLDPQRAMTRLALTVGRSCETERALVVSDGHRNGAEALPGISPSRAVGWVDDTQRADLLVAAGGCGRPLDLYSVDSVSLRSKLLARDVEAAATRLPEPFPPPTLPRKTGARSSFA
jgi:hypothetical protein